MMTVTVRWYRADISRWAEDEVERVCGIVEQEETKETPEIALLKYDNMVCGFVYMERLRESKLNYREADCIRQMANIASGSLKNIDAYEKVYQVSIHDELTGLYNRSYCGVYLRRDGALGEERGFYTWTWIILSYTMTCTENRPATGFCNGARRDFWIMWRTERYSG